MCTVRVDPLVWRVARSTANDLGVPLASLVERQLTEFIRAAVTADAALRSIANGGTTEAIELIDAPAFYTAE